jgi:hypothetical protein
VVIEPFGKIELVTVDLYKTVDVHHRKNLVIAYEVKLYPNCPLTHPKL